MAGPLAIHYLCFTIFFLGLLGVSQAKKAAGSPQYGGLVPEDVASIASHKASLSDGHYKQDVGEGVYTDGHQTDHCQHYESYRYNDGSFTASTGRRVHYTCSSHCSCVSGGIRCEKEKCTYKYYTPYFYQSSPSHSGFFSSQRYNPFSHPFFTNTGLGSGYNPYSYPYRSSGSNLGGGSGFGRNYGGNYGQNHGVPNYGRRHGNTNYGQNHGSPNYGQNHGSPNYGQNHGSTNYGRSYSTGYSYGSSSSYKTGNNGNNGNNGGYPSHVSYNTGSHYAGGAGGSHGGSYGGGRPHTGGNGGRGGGTRSSSSYSDPRSYQNHQTFDTPYDNGRGRAHGQDDQYGYEHSQTQNHNSGNPNGPNFESRQSYNHNSEQGQSYQRSYQHSSHKK